MRLRVEVLRHGLPPAKVLWNAEPEQTVSQLLEQIDDTFPLEADGWGFEDYALQVAGYEVLHYMQLGQLLKDDDQVTIKPLQSNDIRARRVSGRMQITPDGRHLVDGVAFGRPLLRRPARPDLYIPPRKRIRLAEPEEEDDSEDDEDYDNFDGVDARSGDAHALDRLGDHVVEPRNEYEEDEEDEEDDEEYEEDAEEDEDEDEDEDERLAIEGPVVDQVPDMLENFMPEEELQRLLVSSAALSKMSPDPASRAQANNTYLLLTALKKFQDETKDQLCRGVPHNAESVQQKRDRFRGILNDLLNGETDYANLRLALNAKQQPAPAPRQQKRKRISNNVGGQDTVKESDEIFAKLLTSAMQQSKPTPKQKKRNRMSKNAGDQDTDQQRDDQFAKMLLGAMQQKEKPMSDDSSDQDINSPADFLKALAGAMSKPNPAISRQKKGKQVRFQDDREDVQNGDGWDDEEDDQEYEPPSDDDEDMDEDEEEDDNDDYPWDGLSAGAVALAAANSTGMKSTADLTSDSDDTSSSDDTSDSDSDDSDSESESDDSSSDSDSDESSAPSEEGVKPKQQQSIPFEGMAATKRRNARRRDVRKLKYLQSQGILPGTAKRPDLIEWEKKNGGRRGSEEDPSQTSHAKPSGISDSHGVAADESDASSSSSSQEEDLSLPELMPQHKKASTKQIKANADFTDDFQKKREALLAALADGGVDVQAFSAEIGPQAEAIPHDIDMVDGTNESIPAESEAEPSRRKLDVAASQRLLFGSLGVRRPRDDADRQKLRAKLAAQGQRKPVVKPDVAAQNLEQQQQASAEEEGDNQDPNLWKKRINLTAVECVTEDVEYIRPPFPFRQRWDPQMREKKRKRASQAYTAKKGRKTQHDYQDYYAAEGGDALNYDDEAGGEGYADDSYWDDNEGYYDENNEYHYYAEEDAEGGAADETQAAENQLLQESTTSSNTFHADTAPDLPAVPTDLSALPVLTLDNALPGAIITFTRFEVSAATNWAPATPPIRVGQIAAVHDDEGGKVLELQLAKRDMPRKEYDHQGKRVFSGFEMDLGDEEREGFLEVAFAELLEGRIVNAAPESTVEGAAEESEVQDAEVEDKGAAPETNENEEDSPAAPAVGDVVEIVEVVEVVEA